MKKVYTIIVDGQPIDKNVSKKNEKSFLDKYPNATLKSDGPGKQSGANQSQNNQQVNTESSLESTSSASLNNGDVVTPETDIETGSLMDLGIGDTVEVTGIRTKDKSFKHLDKIELSEIVDNTYFKKEEKVVEALQNHYSPFEDITFEEASVGGDSFIVNVGDANNRKKKKFKIDTDNPELWQDVFNFIDMAVDPKLESNVYENILDIIDFDSSFLDERNGRKSEYITDIELKLKYNTTDRELLKEQFIKKQENGEELTEVENYIIGTPSGKKINLSKTDDKSDGPLNYDVSYSETEMINPRLETRAASPLINILNIASLDIESHNLNSNGSIELDNGMAISYDWLLDNSDKIRDAHINRESNKLIETKIGEYGGEENLINYLKENSKKYLNKNDAKLRGIMSEIEKVKNGTIPKSLTGISSVGYTDINSENQEKANSYLLELQKEEEELYKKAGYKKLFNDDGSFKNWQRPESEGGDIALDPKIEKLAEEYALTTDRQTAERDLLKSYADLLTVAKVAARNIDVIRSEWKMSYAADLYNSTGLNDTNSVSQSDHYNDVDALIKVLETNDIFNLNTDGIPSDLGGDLSYLTDLDGSSNIVKKYNELLELFKVQVRALQLNMDPTQTPYQKIVTTLVEDMSRVATGGVGFDGEGENSQVEAFEAYMNQNGLTNTGFLDDSWDNRGRGNVWRKRINYSSEFVSSMTNLIIGMAIVNKGTKLLSGKTWVQVSAEFQKLTKGFAAAKFQSKVAQGIFNTVVVPSSVATAHFTLSEYAYSIPLGDTFSANKPHTFNFNTGKANLWMPITIGTGFHINGALTKSLRQLITTSRFVPKPLKLLYVATPSTITNLFTIPVSSVPGTAILKLGEGLSILSAEGISADTDGDSKTTLEDYGLDWNAIVGTYIGLNMMALPGFPFSMTKGLNNDFKAINLKNWAAKDIKYLGLKNRYKDGSYNNLDLNIRTSDLIGEAGRKLIDKKITKAEYDAELIKIENSKAAIEQLNNMVEAKNIAIKNGVYSDWLIDTYVGKDVLIKIESGRETINDLDSFAQLTIKDLEVVINAQGIKAGSPRHNYLKWYHGNVQRYVNMCNRYNITNKTNPKLKETIVRTLMEIDLNHQKMIELKETIANFNNDAASEIQIKKIRERNKILLEKGTKALEEAKVDFKKEFEAEIALGFAKTKDLGVGLNVLNTRMFNIMLKNRGQESDIEANPGAFIKGDQIYINKDRAIETFDAAIINHEIGHWIFRKSLKNKNGIDISENGIKIIDSMLKLLDKTDRDVIQKRIDENYRYDKNGKEKEKGKYYEEYLTTLGDIIKNKISKGNYDINLGRQLGRIIWPMITNRIAPDLYKDVINGTNSKQAAKDLLDLVSSIQKDVIPKNVVKFQESMPATAEYAASKTSIESLVNKYGNTIDGVLTKRSIQKTISETFFKDSSGKEVKNLDITNTLFADAIKPMTIYLTTKLWNPVAESSKGDLTFKDFHRAVITEAVTILDKMDPSKINKQTFDSVFHQLLWQKAQSINKRVLLIESTEAYGGKGFKGGESEMQNITSSESTGKFDSKQQKLKTKTELKLEENHSTFKNEIGLSSKLINQILESTKTSIFTAKGEVGSSEFIKTLSKNLEAQAYSDILNLVPSGWLENNFKLLIGENGLKGYIPKSDLIQMGKMIDKNLFAEYKGRFGYKDIKLIREFIDKGWIDEGALSQKRLNAGVEVWGDIHITEAQWKEFLNPPSTIGSQKKFNSEYNKAILEGKTEAEAIEIAFSKSEVISNSKGNRKQRIVEILSREIGLDASLEVYAENYKEFLEYKDIQDNIPAKKAIELFSRQIQRQNIKFSKTGAEFVEISEMLTNAISESGIERVFKLPKPGTNIKKRPELTDEFKDVDGFIADFIWNDLYLTGKIFSKNKDQLFAITLQKLIKAGKRGKDYEQYIINKFKNIEGIELLQKTQTEKGDLPDVYAKLYGKMFNVEVKMGSFQAGSITANEININTGEVNIKKLKNFKDAIQIKELVESSIPGWKKIQARLKEMGIEYKSPKDFIPEKAHDLLKKEGFLKEVTVSGIFDQVVVENIYHNKKYPTYYIQIQGKGLYYIGENTLGLNVPKLQGEVSGVWRPVKNSKINKEGEKVINYVYRFFPTFKNIKVKSNVDLSNLGGSLKAKDLFDSTGTMAIEAEIKANYNKSINKANITINKFLKDKVKIGISAFDFDQTVGNTKNVVFAIKGKQKLTLTADEFAAQGEKLTKDGWKFDFSDFDKVTSGTKAEYFDKMKERVDTYGPESVFILTARAPGSKVAIHGWLKQNGINVPIENIITLGNSSAEAKALWMLERVGEGYNDLYFVDDHRANYEAVRDVLKQFDVDSKVIQAKLSKNNSKSFNEMLERKDPNVKTSAKISDFDAFTSGKNKGKFDYFIPPSAEDFKGMLYKFLGKNKQGDADMSFLKKQLIDPYSEAYIQINNIKQRMSEEYSTLLKESKVDLRKKIPGTDFTVDTAIRAYLWNKNKLKVNGMTPAEKKILIDYMSENPNLISFANTLSAISRTNKGYIEPSDYWMIGSIAGDLKAITGGEVRSTALAEWKKNIKEIFSKDNLNKIQKIYGTDFRVNLELMLSRMESGRNRMISKDSEMNKLYDYLNGAVAAIMFWNTRSAALQTLSTVNYINHTDNSIYAASKALANQPQYWKDFLVVFKSPTLKQRRSGNEINVSASELANIFESSKRNPKAILKYLLSKGFTPTRIADSFAIASGGATFYRNRANRYIKEGMSKTEAEKQALLDLWEITENTQQSSRADLISNQQASGVGRVILPFQNTPMQYTRLTKKALSDLVNGRGDKKSNISKILYYGAMQNILFGTIQQGLLWTMFGDDQEKIKKLEQRVANGALDTFLRGTGIYGAGLSTLKNMLMEFKRQADLPYQKKDDARILLEILNVSPPIGTKVRKINNAIKTWKYNKGVGAELGFRIENPNYHAAANIIESITNIPLARALNKVNNLEEAITGDHATWQRAALVLGWSTWSVNVTDFELAQAKVRAVERRLEEKKRIKALEKIIKDEEERIAKEKAGIKTVQCAGTGSNGNRCKLTTETAAKTWKCQHHAAFVDGADSDNDGKLEYRCTGIKKDGKRCKSKGEYTGKVKRCYAHPLK